MNETLFKVEIEKINYYEKYLKNEIFKRNDFRSKDLMTSVVNINALPHFLQIRLTQKLNSNLMNIRKVSLTLKNYTHKKKLIH